MCVGTCQVIWIPRQGRWGLDQWPPPTGPVAYMFSSVGTIKITNHIECDKLGKIGEDRRRLPYNWVKTASR